jgi:hypothetical protein
VIEFGIEIIHAMKLRVWPLFAVIVDGEEVELFSMMEVMTMQYKFSWTYRNLLEFRSMHIQSTYIQVFYPTNLYS